jgi:hypothetical protein
MIRHGYSLLQSALSIQRLLTLVAYSNTSILIDSLRVKSELPKSPDIESRDKPTIPSGYPNESHFVICRICERSIALQFIEAHSKNCALAYESSKSVLTNDEKMKQWQALVKQTVLLIKWPGPEAEAVSTIMPFLRAVVLLDRAIALDDQIPDAVFELEMIFESLIQIALSMADQESADVLKKAVTLITDKLNATQTLVRARGLLEMTGSQPVAEVSCAISDFEFLKRISSGSFARVFLGKKVTTGDMYAIKVIPRASLRQKNEVQRVLAERDILLKFNSAHMLKFCIVFF